MKKVLFVILATAGIIIGMSSCVKTCTCQEYDEDGNIVETYSDEVEPGEKCSDLNEYDEWEDIRCF